MFCRKSRLNAVLLDNDLLKCINKKLLQENEKLKYRLKYLEAENEHMKRPGSPFIKSTNEINQNDASI